ncbi:hypothetical protein SMACR_04889 [Sordaria macrospora]|uniref:WGS project CABT00000000 data, contig 2.1 n=2 Tax=Sordaria macrospora TaxID=5147 RepID=F7VLW8_SORMK|nr:uncharacterized protein SMAC_04889 [Sordaria macrospora k-hell]KAA8627800.1 hypothetical protein SMACR_04889 [Sordaria macrospora]WPJ59464.1 hypothetical protein SMAC4_04889 [Sordaria macrospora]CCC06496.1 unnamed protein product [Sordaria macrospora k-hell]
MYPRRTNNGEGSSRGSGRRENHPRRPPRITIVIRDESVDGPPPHIEREERRHPWPPLPFPPPMVRWEEPPTRPLPPIPTQGRGEVWTRARELLGRNRHFLDHIEHEVAQDRLEARQADQRAQRARQDRQVEEARRGRYEHERRLQEEEAERRRVEHLEEVARRGEQDRQQDANVPAARANPVEARPAPVNRPPGPQIPAPIPAAPVITATTVNAARALVPDPNADNGELVPCAVCTEEFPRSQVFTTSCTEPHHYCGECLQAFFRNSMDGNVWRNADRFPPMCCGNHFYNHANENPSREVRARNQRFHRLLGVDMIRQYFARTQQVQMERDGAGTRCSNADCGWLVPERFTGVEGRRDTEAVCHNCQQVTCTVCEGRAHRTRYQERCPGPRRRIEDQQQAEAQADEEFLRLRREEGWPTCPTCGWTVQRNGGCNLIKCFRCGTYFCYHCLLIYPDGHRTPDGRPLCLCPIFIDGEAEGRIQERRVAGIPEHVPEGEEDDFFPGGDHQHYHDRGHHDRGHHYDEGHHHHDEGNHHHDEGHHHQHYHPRHRQHRHHRHVDYILDHVIEDDDFFHGGDHRDILDHPIEWDSDGDDEDLDADILRFISDVMRRS